jgi:CRP-like cAMP-binding protein
MGEKIWYLKQCSLFEQLTPIETRHLEAQAVTRTFKPRATIYLPTEQSHCVLVLVRGRVKIKTLVADGREAILAFIEEGELFGELALVDTEPRNEFAEAVLESLVLALPRDALLWVMDRRPDVALSITKLVGFRRRRIENRLRNILFRSTRDRVLALLVELLETYGEPGGGRWVIRLPLSHQELASLIGATRESVTLTLNQLQSEGLIEVRRRQIAILQRGRLVEEATGVRGKFPAPDLGSSSSVR